MNIQEIVDDVILTTGRPDQASYVMRAVRAAVTEVHGSAFFPKDRVEEMFELEGSPNRIKLTLPPRFKTFDVLAALSSEGAPLRLTTENNQFTRVDPSAVFNIRHTCTTDVYYVAGATFNILSSIGVPNVYALYYRFPEVADTQLETWIMREQDSLITDLALAKIHARFGREKIAKSMKADWRESMFAFTSQHIVEGLN